MIHRYHDATKHYFHQFARSLGYLDWASQPKPFRSFGPSTASGPGERVEPGDRCIVTLARAFAESPPRDATLVDAVGDVLRHAVGLSAWKRFHESRWALRVNPSSGNLHPTEAYIVAALDDGTPSVFHYAPDRHLLERRCVLSDDAWRAVTTGRRDVWLVAFTSIHWREAWKYGERAFRYCQHDLGHAIGALSIAAALTGRRAAILPEWSHDQIAALAGVDRDSDFVEAEREEPGCLLAVSVDAPPPSLQKQRARLVEAVRGGCWSGRASQLSEDHVEWSIIDDVARATTDSGRAAELSAHAQVEARYSRSLVLQRRSALAFDGYSSIDRSGFVEILKRSMPGPHAPWDALWWSPRIHLAIFVHRVVGLEPGLYLMPRDPNVVDRLRAACTRDFLWERADERIPLFCLARGLCRDLARRLSCDQDIAADGFFSLGMIADFDESLREHGPAFYRHLFWESGVVGQVLYLEAEVAGARATGIGCFYDDAVHDVLGLTGHAFQSLYHFTVGMPVEDRRITTEAPYA